MARAKKTGGKRKLKLTGELTLLQAAELRDALQNELAAGEEVEVVFSKVESVDLSLLQVLCAAHRSARKAGKLLSLPGNLPTSLVKLIDEGGFHGHIGCALDGRVACVWEPQGVSE